MQKLSEEVEEESKETDDLLTNQAGEEAQQELEELYGFDFEEIALRNDELIREDPRNDIKKDLKRRDRYNKFLDASDKLRPYAPEASLGLMLMAGVVEGSEPAMGEYSAALGVGAAACALLYGLSYSLQKADTALEPSGYTILDEDSALEFVEDMDDVRVDGELPHTFTTGEDAAADLDDIKRGGETIAVARSYDDGKKEITLMQDNYPGDDQSPEFESYIISGFSEEPLPEGQPSEENWDTLSTAIDAAPYVEFSDTGWPSL